MVTITHVCTLARVAEMLGEDQDWLEDISNELEPEDGKRWPEPIDCLIATASGRVHAVDRT